MVGSVGAWIYRAIAGIQADPTGPGFEHFDIRSNIICGLESAQASLKILRGAIECRWKATDGKLVLDLFIPVGSQARVFIPIPVGATLLEGDTILWINEQSISDTQLGLKIQRLGQDILCILGSGRYHFQSLDLNQK